MFLDFFFKLKNAKIPVSLNEFLNLLNALDNQIISKLEIPTGNPLLITLSNNKVKEAKYLDASRAKDLIKF